METTIDYASDYGGEASDYQTTMEGKQETENDYRFCPLKLHALLSTPEAVLGTSDYRGGVECRKNICAWWDADKSVAPCYLWPATNNNTPACSWWSGPGLLCALRGVLWAAVRRFSGR